MTPEDTLYYKLSELRTAFRELGWTIWYTFRPKKFRALTETEKALASAIQAYGLDRQGIQIVSDQIARSVKHGRTTMHEA